MQSKFDEMTSDEILRKTAVSLTSNGMEAYIFENIDEAKTKLWQLIPDGSEVMTMSSETLRLSGIADEINNSSRFISVKNKLSKMDRETQNREMQKLGAAPDYAVGSVHAITQDGHVFIASNTGSQLPAYVYAANHVIWIVGAQKIVQNDTEAVKRIYDYILPKESVRLSRQYNKPDLKSNVSKLLIVNKEIKPDRITILLVKENLGF